MRGKALYIILTVMVLMIAIIALLNIYYGQKEPLEKRELTPVSLRLKWLIQAHSAGEFVAKERGIFKKYGIDLTINPGGPDLDSIKLVAAGSDDFGVTGGDQLILARQKGIPVVAIAVLFQRSPVCLFTLKDSGIKTPQDFMGKKVGVKYGTNTETEYRVMMKKLGIPLDSVQEIPVKFDMAPFFQKRVDVWPGYESNEPLIAQEKGYDVNIIYPRDYGVNIYANTYFTTDEILKQKPDLVVRFLKAIIEGWELAIENPEYAVDAVLKYNDQLNRQHEFSALKMTIPIIKADETALHGIGWMTKERWAESQRVLLEGGLLNKELAVDELFTIKYLQEIYWRKK